MNIESFIAARMAEFDALPCKPESVTLVHYPTPELWLRAPEQICSHAESIEINLRLAAELKKRGVPVIFKTAFFKDESGLELAFIICQTPFPGIGWAVLEVPANPEKPFNETKFLNRANEDNSN